MTIKNTDKNISAENEEIVKDIDLQPNGTLKITKKNLYTDSTTEADDSKYLDLKNIKLRLVRISQRDLENLAISNNEQDIVLRETNIFLVPLDDHETDDADEYKEMIWSSDKEAFEKIGTTRLDLDTKVDKVQGKGLSQEDYTTIEKQKLAGIDEHANNYIHPDEHSVSMIDGLSEVAISGDYNDLSNTPSYIQPTQIDEGFLKSDGSIDDNEYLTSLPSHNHDDRYYTKTDIENIMDFFEEQFISKITVGIEIIWDDSNNENQIRPSDLTVTLLRDNEFQDTIVLTKNENWSRLIPNLNDSYSYSWIVSQPIGYFTSSYETNNNITTCVLKEFNRPTNPDTPKTPDPDTGDD